MNNPANSTARLAALQALARELLAYQADAFDNDREVSGADLVDWFGPFREAVREAIGERIDLLAVAIGDAFDGTWLRGPFLDHDSAEQWAEANCGDDSYHVVEIEADPVPPEEQEVRPAH